MQGSAAGRHAWSTLRTLALMRIYLYLHHFLVSVEGARGKRRLKRRKRAINKRD